MRTNLLPNILRVPRWSVVVVLLVLAIVGFAHLSADFPNHSRWSDDAARFTDEGWWASGAIHHRLTGHWVLAHDYNPIVAVPLWPVALDAVFHFTGISAAAARGTAFCFTIGTVLLCGMLMGKKDRALGWAAMLLVGSSPVLFFFSRLAILEPALVFFLMAAALAAHSERPAGFARLVLCGVCCALAMLTKTSALFVAPAIFYLIWCSHRELWESGGEGRRRATIAMIVPAITFAVCYGMYWALVIRTHPFDIHVFYKEAGGGLRLESVRKAIRIGYRCFTWVDAIVFPAAILAGIALIRRSGEIWRDPLFGFAVLFFGGYSAFMVLHLDAEPHYFAVLAVPLMMIALLLLVGMRVEMPHAYGAMGAVLLLAAVVNVGWIARLSLHPEYTLRDASLALKARIAAEGDKAPVVIGHSAIETTLFTRIPALDDMGVQSMDEKLKRDKPGWVVTWIGDEEIYQSAEVARDFSLTEEGRYPALDSATRNAILLYRIHPR